MDATPLAEVWIGAGVSAIASGDVSDRRQFADLTVKTADMDSLGVVNKLTDPNGTTHTGELSDASDLTNHASDSSAHHPPYSDSKAQNAVRGNVDAADLTGGSGSAGQILKTDGSSATWGSGSGGGISSDSLPSPSTVYNNTAGSFDPEWVTIKEFSNATDLTHIHLFGNHAESISALRITWGDGTTTTLGSTSSNNFAKNGGGSCKFELYNIKSCKK
jgi:hypothetical protein